MFQEFLFGNDLFFTANYTFNEAQSGKWVTNKVLYIFHADEWNKKKKKISKCLDGPEGTF